MTKEQAAAFVMAAAARAIVRAEGMAAENNQRKGQGKTAAYDEGAFLRVIEEEGIGHNAVLIIFQRSQDV